MKIFIIKLILYGLIFFIVNSCSDNIVNEPRESSGVLGMVVDTAGKPIPDVKIFCLYWYDYYPIYPNLNKENFKFFTPGSFDFELKQNFPNPVQNSTFIRFSLPYDCDIKLTIKNKISGQIVYSLNGTYAYGLYQQYLGDIVSNLQLENGNYIITLTAKGSLGQELIAEKNLFVVSVFGQPNAITERNGSYFFDYQKAFINDTVFITYVEDNPFPKQISNRVYLYFIKEGYFPSIVSVDLISNFLLRRDVILYKE